VEKKTVNRKQRLILLLCLLLIVGFLATSLVSYFVSRASLRKQIASSELPLTSDNIYSEIQRDLLRPIFISSLMAHDTFVRDWILDGEDDESQIAKYLNVIMGRYGTFTSFLVSDRTKTYYHANGILKKISPDEERDVWYYRVRDMAEEYEINVDPDLANRDAMTIFINHKVFDYSGNYIGATGVGLTINAVVSLIDSYSSKYRRSIYFSDPAGQIVLHGAAFSDSASTIHELEGLSPEAESILSKEGYCASFSRNGQIVHLNTRYVPELDWYLYVEQTESQAIRQIHKALLINLALCALITGVVILITTLTINAYQKINQKQQDSLKEQKNALEIAVSEKSSALDRNELLLSEMNHRVKNNLTTLQSLLRLQSAKMTHAESRFALKESESRIRSIANIHSMLSRTTDLTHVSVIFGIWSERWPMPSKWMRPISKL